MTDAISMAYDGKIPPKEMYHEPDISNMEGYTVAISLAYNGIIPP